MDREIVTHETSPTCQPDLADGYRQMAADIEHEMEAEEWSEALIADIATDEGHGFQHIHSRQNQRGL